VSGVGEEDKIVWEIGGFVPNGEAIQGVAGDNSPKGCVFGVWKA